MTIAATDSQDLLTPSTSTEELHAYDVDISTSKLPDSATFTSSPLRSPALTLVPVSDEDDASKVDEPEPEVEPTNSPQRSHEEERAADAERRHAALLEMLSHEPPQLWRPRRRRRTADGGLRMNGTGPRSGAPSPTSTTTTFLTDEAAESVITLPPRYADYGSPVVSDSSSTR